MSFNSVYIALMKRYVLFESFGDIPAAKLGLSTSLSQLPEVGPYGFWVDRHGNFIVCDTYGSHANVAGKFISVANIPYDKTIYLIMYEHGFMRVVSESDYIWYVTKDNRPASHSQTKFLKYIKGLYNKEKVIQDTGNKY